MVFPNDLSQKHAELISTWVLNQRTLKLYEQNGNLTLKTIVIQPGKL